MKKRIFILLILFGMSQLYAETLFQIYPPSWFGLVSGRNTMFSGFEENEDEPKTYNLPIEIRQTLAKSSVADLMFTGGLSFYSEKNTLSSVNLSSGLTFGYGYNGNKRFFRNANITIYALYEFPLAIFWRTPSYPWKYALDINWELMNVRPDPNDSSKKYQFPPISINLYIRTIGTYTKDGPWVSIPDAGLTIGWLLNK